MPVTSLSKQQLTLLAAQTPDAAVFELQTSSTSNGATIHTGAGTFDEVYLSAINQGTSDVNITFNVSSEDFIFKVPARGIIGQDGVIPLFTGDLILPSGVSLKGYASATGILLLGYVIRHGA